ncbi:hypothetical protein [Streptomyces sp. 900105245]
MTDTHIPPGEPGAALPAAGRFFRPGTPAADLHSVTLTGGREGNAFHRDRWSRDKAVHSTHGASVGPDRPECEPRGCPRGAAFSWYTYSPTRVRHPYVRGVLLEMYREAKGRLRDPVVAWADILDEEPDTSAAVGDARRLEESALPEGCSLEYKGGPGVGGDGPFGQDSGRKNLPLVSVENFRPLRRRQTSDDTEEA